METVKNAVTSGRFPHAFIIEGEPGSGRHTLARIIAAAAVCNDSDAPCGRCRECTLIAADNHCDVLTYAPDGASFKVDTVREIRDNAYIIPIEAKRKVNILLECEKMNEQAQNALLKVLEEPPDFMVFILVCGSAAALLPTVRSRCVTLSVRNPDKDEAVSYLRLKTDRPEQDISDALALSHGNIGAAEAILNGDANNAAESAANFFESLVKRNRLGALGVLYRFEKDRPGFNAFLSELRMLLCEQIKLYSLGTDTALRPASLSAALAAVESAEDRLRGHIGQPLSLPVMQTALCAEIFADL